MKTERVKEILDKYEMTPSLFEKLHPHKYKSVAWVGFNGEAYTLLNVGMRSVKLFEPKTFEEVFTDINTMVKWLKAKKQQNNLQTWGSVSWRT